MKKTISVIATLVIASSMMFTSCKPKQEDQVNPTPVVVKTDSVSFTDLPHTVSSSSINLAEYANSTDFTIVSVTGTGANFTGTTLTFNNTTSDVTVTFTVKSNSSGKTTTSSILFTKTTSSSTNTAPVAKIVTTKSIITTLKASDYASDANGDRLKFAQKPTSSNGTFTLNADSTQATFTASSTPIYYGDVNVQMMISDGKASVNANYTGTVGTSAQIATYEILAPMFGLVGKTGTNPAGLQFNSDMTMKSTTKDSGFYGEILSNTGTFKIKTDGSLVITSNSQSVSTFTVSLVGNNIYLLKNSTYYQIVK